MGKFNSEEKRRAAFCAEDDGSLQTGFLCAVRGTKVFDASDDAAHDMLD